MEKIKNVILCWKNRETKEDDFKIISRDIDRIDEFRFHSAPYQATWGTCNSEYDNLNSFEKFVRFLQIFFKYNLKIDNERLQNSTYIIKYNDLKNFLYELGKIEEFKCIRKLRYQLFTDDEFDKFSEYEAYNWE